MGTEKYFVSKLHNSTYRKYLHRMNDNKVQCMKIAKQYEKKILGWKQKIWIWRI